MATSGSSNFYLTGTAIILEALELLGIAGAGQPISSEDQASCLRTLNMMVKAWQADGVGLWKNTEATLFPSSSGYSYSVGPSGDNCSSTGLKTELAADAASGATSITVDASVSFLGDELITNGTFATVTGDNPTSWTIIGTENGSTNVVAVAGGACQIKSTADESMGIKQSILTAGSIYSYSIDMTAATSGTLKLMCVGGASIQSLSAVTTYTGYFTADGTDIAIYGSAASADGKIDNVSIKEITTPYVGVELDDGTVQWNTPLTTPGSGVITLATALSDEATTDNHVYYYDAKLPRPLELVEVRSVAPSGYETPLSIISREEYLQLSNKTSTGSANQVYYDPLLTNGKLYIWPACSDVQEYLKFTCRIPFEDFDTTTNDPDFPPEWMMALAWNLAVYVAPKFGKSVDQIFQLRAEALKESVRGFDRENAAIFLGVK